MRIIKGVTQPKPKPIPPEQPARDLSCRVCIFYVKPITNAAGKCAADMIDIDQRGVRVLTFREADAGCYRQTLIKTEPGTCGQCVHRSNLVNRLCTRLGSGRYLFQVRDTYSCDKYARDLREGL